MAEIHPDLQREIATDALPLLHSLLNDHSAEIPEKIVRSTDPNPFYKVRKAWFASIRNILGALMNVGIISREDPKMAAFDKEVVEPLSNSDQLTTAEHIRRGDEIIRWAQGELRTLLQNTK